MRDRQTYATTGARILLWFEAAGLTMGSEGRAAHVRCRAQVHAVVPLDRVEVVKDGQAVASFGADALDAELDWDDPAPPSREHFYYLRAVQRDGQMAWSSPIWVGPAADGD